MKPEDYNNYDAYLEEWIAPVHASETELSPMNKSEFDNLTELTEEEEKALEQCLESFEPASTTEYINIIAALKDL